MIYIVILLFVVNAVSFYIARILQQGKLVKSKDFPDYNGRAIMIGGFMSQASKIYKKVEAPYSVKGYLDYSLFGFEPRAAGIQLRELIKTDDVIIGSGLGCKTILMAHRYDVERYFICPATHSLFLKNKYKNLLKIFTPILTFFMLILGWLSILPVIRTKYGSFYSLALLSDQMYWLINEDPRFNDIGDLSNTYVIQSMNDKYLENLYSESLFNQAKKVTIDFEHADIATNSSIIGKQIVSLTQIKKGP